MQPQTRWVLVLLALLASLALAPHCKESGATVQHEDVGTESTSQEPIQQAPEARASQVPDLPPGVRRLVAFGDVHGDLAATRKVLRLLGAIDKDDRWIGGDMQVVQTGDILDRGDQERAIIDMFLRLQVEAKQAGGAFIVLSGNHEVMNVQWDFRYVTPGGWADFKDVPNLPESKDPAFEQLTPEQRPRALAFMPGGPYAKRLAKFPVIAVVEGTIFVHGGVLPKHVDYGLDKINQETSAWMRGETVLPAPMAEGDSPIWDRRFSLATDEAACALLAQTLQKAGAVRMVVGHTPNTMGISSACNDKVWRIDTGMASYYRGVTQALELTQGNVRIVKDSSP